MLQASKTTGWVSLHIGVRRMPGQSITAEFAAGEDGQSHYPSSSESPRSRPLTLRSRDRSCLLFALSTSFSESIDAYASRIDRSLMPIQTSYWSDAWCRALHPSAARPGQSRR
jgi:hypothetical protein